MYFRSQLQDMANTDGGIYGSDVGKTDTVGDLGIKSDDIRRSLELKGYEANRRKASDSGYESVAVDREIQKDFSADVEAASPGADIISGGDLCVSSASIDLNTTQRAPPAGVEVQPSKPPPSTTTQIFEATFNVALSPRQRQSRDQAKEHSRGSSKEPSPSASGGKTASKPEVGGAKKQSIIDKFGGLFLSYKDKDGAQQKKMAKKGSVKKPKDKDKDVKATGGIVKKDSFKRKVGLKGKEEVYVTTPVVRQKHPNFHQIAESDNSKSTSDDRIGNSAPFGGRFAANNVPKKAAITANGRATAGRGAPWSPTGGADINGSGASSESAEDEKHTPSILFGNVKNKRKLFENNGMAS